MGRTDQRAPSTTRRRCRARCRPSLSASMTPICAPAAGRARCPAASPMRGTAHGIAFVRGLGEREARARPTQVETTSSYEAAIQRPSQFVRAPCRPESYNLGLCEVTLGVDWRWHGADLDQGTQRTKPACLGACGDQVSLPERGTSSGRGLPRPRSAHNHCIDDEDAGLEARAPARQDMSPGYLQGRWRLVDAGRFTRRGVIFRKCHARIKTNGLFPVVSGGLAVHDSARRSPQTWT